MKMTMFGPLALCGVSAAVLIACVTPALGKSIRVERSKPAPVEETPPEEPMQSGTVKMYEWGVQRENWDGSAVTPNDVPDFYYSASEVPIGEAPADPAVSPPTPPRPDREPCAEKPVVYFECDKDVAFSFQVASTVGALTWMYPKPSRRTSESAAQWDKVELYPDGVKRGEVKLPALHDVVKGHWSEFSREGGTSTVVVNGEAERFLFYEGTNKDLPEVDVCQNDKGEIVLRNFSCQPVHELRLRLKVKDQWRAWFVREIAAASADVPSELKLTDASVVDLAAVRKAGIVADDAKAAGLTASQAAVFERCWADTFLKGDNAVLTYRLDAAILDENFALTAKLPNGMTLESKRAGYKWFGGIDLSKQADLDKLAASAATGDKDAGDSLRKGGAAAIGAIRRASLNHDLPLRQRLNLAQLLKSMSGNSH